MADPITCRAFVESHQQMGHEVFLVTAAMATKPTDLTPEIVEFYVAEMAKEARRVLTKAMNGGPK